MLYLAREVQKKLSFRKNLGFQFISPKTRRRKIFGRRDSRAWSIMTLSKQLSNKQMDTTNAFVENVRQSEQTQWAMGIVESVSEKFKNFFFFDGNWPRKFLDKTTARHSIEWWSID